jgi:sulfotransferase
MHDKTVYFLSGLPRTGSTLLGAILSQNPDIHVTATSPLCPLLAKTSDAFRELDNQHTFNHDIISKKVYNSIISAFLDDIDKPIIFDKHRAWPAYINPIKQYINPNVKIICTIRPIPEIITSYLALADNDKSNFIDKHLKKLSRIVSSESRADLLWSSYIKPVYDILTSAKAESPESLLMVEYRDIVYSSQKTIDRIYKFCGIPKFSHQFKNISPCVEEDKDAQWGMKNLHRITNQIFA